jgi:hypothetical protein
MANQLYSQPNGSKAKDTDSFGRLKNCISVDHWFPPVQPLGTRCLIKRALPRWFGEPKGQMEALEKLALIILASIPERLETPILIMINRKKVFTVLGLMLIRFAISLLERPCNNNSTACCSRGEKLNCWAIRGTKSNPEELRSSRSSSVG